MHKYVFFTKNNKNNTYAVLLSIIKPYRLNQIKVMQQQNLHGTFFLLYLLSSDNSEITELFLQKKETPEEKKKVKQRQKVLKKDKKCFGTRVGCFPMSSEREKKAIQK